MGKKLFLLDADKCTSCKMCVIACKDEHVDASYKPWTGPQPDTGHFWVDIKSLERGAIPRVKLTHMPVFCQHCDDAPCITACPDDAIKKRDDGLVWIDEPSCTGCRECVSACPYDVVFMNDELNVAQKCTGCAHRVDEGLAPRCADVCPHDAILFGEEGDAIFKDSEDEKPLEIYLPEEKAAPRAFWRGLPKPWIAGAVLDAANDEVVIGASISVADDDGNTTSAQSDAFGNFWVRDLSEGKSYNVTIAAEGFASVQQSMTVKGDLDLGMIELKGA